MILLYLLLTANCAEKIIQLPKLNLPKLEMIYEERPTLDEFLFTLNDQRNKELEWMKRENRVFKAWIEIKRKK